MSKTIHEKALKVLGVNEALAKLDEEILELRDEVMDMLLGCGSYEKLLHEILDVQFVLKRIRLIPGLVKLLEKGIVHTHEFGDGDKILGAREKLQKAINETEVKDAIQ